MTTKPPFSSQNNPPFFLCDTPVLVSACLLGLRCRYDGREKGAPELIRRASSAFLIPFCPEQLGGLPTPRPAARIVDGDGYDVLGGRARVINDLGADVTRHFVRGAEEALTLARTFGAGTALVKDKSPSCGHRTTRCGTPSGLGAGVAAALLERSGMRIVEVDSQSALCCQAALRSLREGNPSIRS